MNEMKQGLHDLREALSECIHRCNHCFNGCLREDDVKRMADCIRLDRDCIEACSMAMKFLYPGSRFQREVLMLCKNVCIVTGEECAKFGDMDHCRRCAEACKVTAERIDDFLKAHAEHHAAKMAAKESGGGTPSGIAGGNNGFTC